MTEELWTRRRRSDIESTTIKVNDKVGSVPRPSVVRKEAEGGLVGGSNSSWGSKGDSLDVDIPVTVQGINLGTGRSRTE